MLVISSSFVLADGALPGTPLIGWHNIVTPTNLDSSYAAANYPLTNLANPATDLQWRSDTIGLQHIKITTADVSVDYVGIVGHNFGSAQIPVSIGYFEPDEVTWVELVQEQIFANDDPVMFQFTPQPSTTLWVRMAEGDAAPQASVLYAGTLLILPRGVDINADFVAPPFGRKSTIRLGRSESGQYLGRNVVRQELEWTADFAHFDPVWYRAYFDPFVRAAQEDVPFFYAWAPDDYPYEVAFAWFRDDPIPQTNPVTGRKRVKLSCGGLA